MHAHLSGEPDTLPPVWCGYPQAEVAPQGKGRCPRCQTFLRLNFGARGNTRINRLRREELFDTLISRYHRERWCCVPHVSISLACWNNLKS